MQVPKLLPWIARKAGITDHDALLVWEAARDEAAAQAGTRNGPTFHRLALERFVALAHLRAATRAAKPAAPARAPGLAGRWQRPVAHACPG